MSEVYEKYKSDGGVLYCVYRTKVPKQVKISNQVMLRVDSIVRDDIEELLGNLNIFDIQFKINAAELIKKTIQDEKNVELTLEYVDNDEIEDDKKFMISSKKVDFMATADSPYRQFMVLCYELLPGLEHDVVERCNVKDEAAVCDMAVFLESLRPSTAHAFHFNAEAAVFAPTLHDTRLV